MKAKTLSVKSIVAIGIGTALFFVLMRYVSIPTPIPNTTLGIQYSIQALVAALFGPIAGMLVGLIGHMLNDMATGWGVWWSWVLASGVFGLLFGLPALRLKLHEGRFNRKDIILFNVSVAIAHVICWGVVAPALDIAIYSEPANKVFLQGLFASVGNIVATCVVGTLLCLAYAKSKPQAGSLSKD